MKRLLQFFMSLWSTHTKMSQKVWVRDAVLPTLQTPYAVCSDLHHQLILFVPAPPHLQLCWETASDLGAVQSLLKTWSQRHNVTTSLSHLWFSYSDELMSLLALPMFLLMSLESSWKLPKITENWTEIQSIYLSKLINKVVQFKRLGKWQITKRETDGWKAGSE